MSVDLGNRNVKKGVAVGVDELGGLILDTGEVISMGDVTHLD